METYLKLTFKNRKKLHALAQAKQLSISATAYCIIVNLYPILWSYNKYFENPETCIHIKLHDDILYKNKITACIASNCIAFYFNNEALSKHLNTDLSKILDYKTINSRIQSKLDKTIDPNYNKAMEIRIQYRIMKMKELNK